MIIRHRPDTLLKESVEETQSQSVPTSQPVGEHGGSASASMTLPSPTEVLTLTAKSLESRWRSEREVVIAPAVPPLPPAKPTQM